MTPSHSKMSSLPSLLPLLSLTALIATTSIVVTAQPDPNLKYKFFCGSSFADIQTDVCASRQWCPSSSDDECLVPGHTCFANTPCDARDLDNISVPTYSLSLNPEYRDPTDKMFCGTDYSEATATCAAGGDVAKGRHCPDMNCPSGMTCYIELPCSYFVLTDPSAHPLGNVNELDSQVYELPDPGSLESNYFCGATFQQAAQTCSSQTWCRTGTSQECPNGQTCFVSVNTENPECEINAIKKAEYEYNTANSKAPSPTIAMMNTDKPTFPMLAANDPKNTMFCGSDWNDASDNCVLERFCPNGNDDCGEGMRCFDYTRCNAFGMTGTPTKTPTKHPTDAPTPSPINTSPTTKPTTSKPSRTPTPKPTGVPTPKPTGVPSKKPTYAPLAFGDFRREFWCGLSYFDAVANCAKKCPGGQDEECPGNLSCMSGVADCKNEMGMGAYETAEVEDGVYEFPVTVEDGGGDGMDGDGMDMMDLGDVPPLEQQAVTLEETMEDEANDSSSPPPPAPTPKTQEEDFPVLGGKNTAASKPKPVTAAKPSGLSLGSVSTVADADDIASALVSDGSDEDGTPALQGPFYEEMVRIILYGLDQPLEDGSLNRWKIMTKMYMEQFFNKYPTQEMIDAGETGPDTIRSNVYDVVVEITDEVAEMAPMHDFSPLVVGAIGRGNLRTRNLRSNVTSGGDPGRQMQNEPDMENMIMVTYSQTANYRSTLDVLNDDPSFIYQRPLETPEYRAEYVNYLRSQDFATFGNLEYASKFLYTEFPTGAPSYMPTPAPSIAPIVPGTPTQAPQTEVPTSLAPTGLPPTPNPTERFGCNLCRPGQCGINADIIFNGSVSSCMQVYNWHLDNYFEGSGACRAAGEQLNSICCRDGCPYPPGFPTMKPSLPAMNTVAQPDSSNMDEPEPEPPAEPQQVNQPAPAPKTPNPTPKPTPQPTLKPTPKPVVPQAQPKPPTPPTPQVANSEPTETLEIPVDDMGLPDAASLAETYYCGSNWDAIDCDTAQPCPSGDKSDCPQGESCIAFTNCGGKFAFVSDPSVEGGGPDPDEVRSTFYCGTSMQFLEMKCDGSTPCPNGPEDCEGDGEKFGCFAFTGCNEQIDPGKFVGFLKPPDEDDVNGPVPIPGNDKAFFCAKSWDDLDSKCENGVPEGARACPSGDILECDDGQGCFAFACGGGVSALVGVSQPAPAPSNPSEYSVEDMDLLKSTFFCGTSIEEIDGDCENAIPCPTGDECPQGFGCFAFSQCGGVDIEGLVDTFGNTERPTRAPTVPIEQICDEERKMSVNVGYWQSWSIYRDEDCQQMDTASFDGAPYSHIVYSFASIDSSFRLEAWNGTYDNEVPLYKDFNTVKQRHPDTKTMIAVGGWTHNDPGPMQKRFSQMASSKTNRQTFANSVVQFLRTYGFDGLDLDWEYPSLKERGGKRADYDNYVLMTKELRDAFNRAPENYELTIAIPGNITKLEMGFDLAGLAEHVDWFNIMAYDLWGSWDPKQIAYSHTDIRMIDEAVEYMSHFIQRSKLVMGLGSYARTYTLEDDDCLDLGCPFDGPGKAGCEGTDGFLPYFEIADLITKRKFDTVRYDDETMSMVMVTDGNRLISYDNTVSFNRKIDYATEMCMMGDMLWAIDMLQDGSNPLGSSNGNSAATGDPSDQSFCGKDFQDVLNGCKQPCTSGDSSQCAPDEQCFANTGCSIDNIGAPPPTKCRLCPDPSTQGMKDWLEIDYDGESMTCGDADMSVIAEFEKGSEECDSAKQTLGDTCCYNYPENPCMLCRSETEFMDLRAMADIEFDGEEMTCFDLSKRLGPEENDSEMCSSAQEELWDSCCYNQCTLCQDQGVKWWNEVEFEEEPYNCGELDAKLYSDETEEEDEECAEIVDEFVGECCYDYPDDPCDVCTTDGKKLTLMPNEEVEYEGSTFTCAEVNNFLSPFESSSDQCVEVKGLASGTCCFDRCSLCGEGARLDPEVLVAIEGEEGSEEGTCADIESALFTEQVLAGSEECTSERSLHYDACCFEIPSSPCQLCATDEYMHHTTKIEFNGDEVTCRSASNYLMEREDTSSDSCSEAKATIAETCCYSTCNMCGDFDLDWDVFVNFEGKDMNCGDFNEIFREEAVVDGSEQCEELKSEFFDTCCYSSPTTSCQLCKQGDTFFDLNDNVEVDFNGPTTCYEVANFMSRRTEDTDPACGVTQTSLFDECCYEKCNLADEEGTYPDWAAEVEMEGNVATCLELDGAIKDAAIAKDTPECQSLQDAFSPLCSYSIPENACDICPDNAVSIEAKAEWNGSEMKCSDIKSRISSREEEGSQVCTDAQDGLQGSCCIDQCEVCDKPQKTDFVLTVYHDGKTKQCTEVDIHFYEKSILASSDECSETKSQMADCCYTEPETPCNLCKRDTEYFDLMGTSSVTYMGQKMSCSDVSDMMFRREEEEGGTCSSAKEELFDACCDTKCSLCAGKGLEAGVKVSFEGRMMTCLELDLGLGPAAIEAGSDQCNEITGRYSENCCYEKPESPCRICPGDEVGVNKEASVNYLGSETTCESLSNYLGSREEQEGEACKAAASDHSEDCCYERCSLCDDGKADWETFVTYEGQSIACGDFEWILRGKSVEAGSDTCNAVKDEFYDKCCYEPPETSCNLCHVDGDYFDVSADVQVNYQGSQMKCLSLYNSLFVREAGDSDQCQAAKDDHAESCCFEKCKMCQSGFLDTTAMVNVEGNDISCSALDMSFSKDVVVEGSDKCDEKRAEYSDACCFTIPDNPCRVCSSGSDVDGDVTVDFYGETKSCGDVANKLAMSEEAGTATCSSTQNDFSSACCFERCEICSDGYNLNWEVDVEYNRATIACGEFDNILRGNAIQKGTQECSSLRSTYSSACCYNYATAGAGYAAETTLAQVTTTGFLSTNLDTSNLTPLQKEDAKQVFQNLIKKTLEAEGVLPAGSTVTVRDIDQNGVVSYEIDMLIDDSVAGAVGAASRPALRPAGTTSSLGRPTENTSSLGQISELAVDEIDSTLSNPTVLDAIADEIQSEARANPDQAVVEELSNVSVTDFTSQGTNLATQGEAEVSTPGVLDTNLDVSNLNTAQREEVQDVVEASIENTLQAAGVLTPQDTVTVTEIDDQGDVEYQIDSNVDSELDTTLDDISQAVAQQIDEIISNPVVLEAIADDIQSQAPDMAVAQELETADVTSSTVEESTAVTTGDSTEVSTTGVLETNLDMANLTTEQQEEVQDVVQNSITDTLQAVGVLSPDNVVSVTEINDEGEVAYEMQTNIDSELDSSLEDISQAVSQQIDETLSNPVVLEAITDEIQSQALDEAVAQKLETVEVSSSSVAVEEATVLTTGDSTEVSTTGVLETNLDTTNLTTEQQEDVQDVVENSITDTLQAVGVLAPGDTVSVTNIDDDGEVAYEVDKNIQAEIDTSLYELTTAFASRLGGTLSNPVVLEAITDGIQSVAPDASNQVVAQELTNVDVSSASVAVEEATATTVGDSTEVSTTGVLETNLNPSTLSAQQLEEVQAVVEVSVENALQALGALSPQDTVTVTEINDIGEVAYEVKANIDTEVDSTMDDISSAVAQQMDSTLSNPVVLEAIADEIQSQALDEAVAQELETVDVSSSSVAVEDTTVLTVGDSTEVSTTGVLETNLDTANLTTEQQEEVQDAVEASIENALQAVGVLTPQDTVIVKEINDIGEVQYEVQTNIDLEVDSTLNDISSAVGSQMDSTLNNPVVLEAIVDGIQSEAPDMAVAQELEEANVSSSSVAAEEATVLTVGDSTEVSTTGVLETNLDMTNLTNEQQEEVQDAVENSIKDTLQAVGALSSEDTVTVKEINDEGDVTYEVQTNINEEVDSTLDDISSAVAQQIDESLSNPVVLGEISNEIQSEAPEASDLSIAEELSLASVADSTIDLEEVFVTKPGETTDVSTAGVLETNLDLTTLNTAQREEAEEVVENSITTALQSEGVLSTQDAVTVTEIDDQGDVSIEVDFGIDSTTLDDISQQVAQQIDETLKNPVVLEAISDEIQSEAPDASNEAVAQELEAADITSSSVAVKESVIVTSGDSTEVIATGVLETNLNPSTLTTQQKEEVQDVVQASIENTLQAVGALTPQDSVTVTEIDDNGDVAYEVDKNINAEIDSEIDSTLAAISQVVVSQIDETLSSPAALDAISDEIQAESTGSSAAVAQALSNAELSDSSVGETNLLSNNGLTEISTTGTLDTNIDTTNLTPTEKEEAIKVVENSLENSLQSEGILPEKSDVIVTQIDDQGEVKYEIDLSVGSEPEPESPPPPETTSLSDITDAIVAQIDQALTNPSTLETISNEIQAEAADSSVAKELSSVSVSDFVQGETSVVATGAATGAGPCNLCKAGEIGLSKDILFNGVQTSCPEVYKFLSTQSEAGSEACDAGKKALHDECCIRKCDICSGGGIPDWYGMVNVNGNSMTCLELDGIVAESEIQSGSDQCSQLLEVAAPSCCYEPPTTPCNMCQNNGSKLDDVMSSTVVEYGGTTSTCGQIFNTLFSREEHDSETCSLIKQDLAPQCCYNKCSLCGDLQNNAALSVVHDETQLGCSEFDSYIFATNAIEEGSNECKAFQDEHKESCCYDISCSLCAKGNELYTTKETSMVQYGGAEVTCGEVANFLYQEEMSQGNACLAAQDNIFNECCFQQCEICEGGASINWAAATTFNGESQSCTDVYWLLVSESVEAGTQTCRGLSQVSRDCCFEIPSQQCTLCKDDNGATYNTRWNKEVTVNGITKTCGDFNTLLATQEDDSQTCSMAKNEIFGDCCFAGSDTLVAIANQASTESDAPCSLCQPGQVGVVGDVVFNNSPTTCEEVYNFLIGGFRESDTTCKSAQVKLAEDCCKEQDKLSPGEKPAFGGDPATTTDNEPSVGEGSVTAEKPEGTVVTPPMEFDTWSRRPSGSTANASFVCTVLIGAFSFGLFILS